MGVSWHSLATAQEGRGITIAPLTTGQNRAEPGGQSRAWGGPLGSAPPSPTGDAGLGYQGLCRGMLRLQTTPQLPPPAHTWGRLRCPPTLSGRPQGAPAVPGQSSLLLAGGELADLAAGRAGLAGGVGGGAGPALALGPGAQLPRLRPVHAHGLGQPPAAALPVLPGLLLRHLSCKGTATVRGWQQSPKEHPPASAGHGSCCCGRAEPAPVRIPSLGCARLGASERTSLPTPLQDCLAPVPPAQGQRPLLPGLPGTSGSSLAPLGSSG